MFEDFFKNSNEILCIASLEGRFLHINDAFVDLLGHSREELLSKSFIEFVHQEDIERTLSQLEQIGNGGSAVGFENRYLDVNDKIKVLSWHATLDPKTNYVIASARDVTFLRLQENKHAQLFNAVTKNVIYAKTDRAGVITEVSDMFCQISGYSREELVGRTHKVINSGVHDKAFFKEMWKTISSGQVWHGAITNKKKDGSLYVVASCITPLLGTDGRVESYVAIRQDITKRIQYKQDSLKNLELLNETGAMARVGGWEFDLNSETLFWSDETYRILGVDKGGDTNINLELTLELFVPEHQDVIKKALVALVKSRAPFALELQVKDTERGIKWVYITGKAKIIDDGCHSISGTIQDINDKKMAELRYRQERQRSFQNAKFAALGELAASVAHEINNPLGIISGYAELLQYQGNSDDNQLKAIMKSCDRISHIVKNLKRFSRSDNAPKKSKVDLSEIVLDAISLTNPRARRHMAEIYYEQQGPIYVWGNHIELEQVVINLINNAVDAVSKRVQRLISITMVESSASVLMAIEDSGGGILDELKYRMFEPFVTTKNENNGTGLGLSVVKGILDDHCGQIIFQNIEQGARFEITLNKFRQGITHG